MKEHHQRSRSPPSSTSSSSSSAAASAHRPTPSAPKESHGGHIQPGRKGIRREVLQEMQSPPLKKFTEQQMVSEQPSTNRRMKPPSALHSNAVHLGMHAKKEDQAAREAERRKDEARQKREQHLSDRLKEIKKREAEKRQPPPVTSMAGDVDLPEERMRLHDNVDHRPSNGKRHRMSIRDPEPDEDTLSHQPAENNDPSEERLLPFTQPLRTLKGELTTMAPTEVDEKKDNYCRRHRRGQMASVKKVREWLESSSAPDAAMADTLPIESEEMATRHHQLLFEGTSQQAWRETGPFHQTMALQSNGLKASELQMDGVPHAKNSHHTDHLSGQGSEMAAGDWQNTRRSLLLERRREKRAQVAAALALGDHYLSNVPLPMASTSPHRSTCPSLPGTADIATSVDGRMKKTGVTSPCFNCGSFTHVFRDCSRPVICAYCCCPGHVFHLCHERDQDIRLGKQVPTEDALLEWCRRSHEPKDAINDGPSYDRPPSLPMDHSTRAMAEAEPSTKLAPRSRSSSSSSSSDRSRSRSYAGSWHKAASHSPSYRQRPKRSGSLSDVSDINAVMAKTAARLARKRKAEKEASKKRKRSVSPKKKQKQKQKQSPLRRPMDNKAGTAHALVPPPAGPPPVLPTSKPPQLDIRAQLKEQLQRLQPEKQLQLIQEQIRKRQEQQEKQQQALTSADADVDAEEQEPFSLNDILSGAMFGSHKAGSGDGGDLNNWLRSCAGPSADTKEQPSVSKKSGKREPGQSTPDINQHDVYDIFADTDVVPDLPTAVDDAAKPMQAEDTRDAEGYYQPRIGELLNNRYRVQGILGRGVFGVVVNAVDTAAVPSEDGKAEAVQVAIKIARSNSVMETAAKNEVSIIQSLNTDCPQERSKCISVHEIFWHQQHYCIVMELMHLNLREFLKKYGVEEGMPVGLHIDAVRLYARDILQGLNCLQRSGIFHGDLKPDNILVNQQLKGVRICDFGTAIKVGDCEPTPYMCSRYYRAPEIILGLGYGHAADMWAAGCTFYELYTGQILFKGETNNEMLKLFMALKGRFANKLLKVAQFSARHFDESFAFLHTTIDPISKKVVVKKMLHSQPLVDLKALLRVDLCRPDEKQKVLELADLLDHMLQLDPALRLTAAEALQHPFITSRRA